MVFTFLVMQRLWLIISFPVMHVDDYFDDDSLMATGAGRHFDIILLSAGARASRLFYVSASFLDMLWLLIYDRRWVAASFNKYTRSFPQKFIAIYFRASCFNVELYAFIIIILRPSFFLSFDSFCEMPPYLMGLRAKFATLASNGIIAPFIYRHYST